MKSGVSSLLLAVLASLVRTLGGTDISPVTRVVQLLQELQKLCEENLNKETSAFEKYKCWATTTQQVKKASNEKAQARVDSLEQYIADLEAGRIELTSERVDLEKEISSLTADMETAEALRKQENEDFLAAKDETEKAIEAIDEAVEVLEEAQPKGGAAASFLTAGRGSGSRSVSRAADFERLSTAIKFGRRFLSKGDSVFLERVLTGDVPEWDWKKLNRKATFKMSYETRTKKIVQTLKNLKWTFSQTLDDMIKKENKAQDTYDKLMESKTKQKDEAEEALSKMELEGAARGQTKTEAQEEIDDLEEQIKNDKGFISQAKQDLEDKEKEWVDRKKIRIQEIAAISKAIEVLHSDDAKDLFKRSLSSQGYVQISSRGFAFLQESRSRVVVQHLLDSAPARASDMLLKAAASASETEPDVRLVELARNVSEVNVTGSIGDDKFDRVINMIDKIIKLLEDEEKDDLDTKEDCEQARSEDTRSSILIAREIDELSDTITVAKQKIAEYEAQIEEKEEEKKVIQEEIAAAKKIRSEEKAAHAKADKDDKDAVTTIGQAIGVLEEFYKNLNFLQRQTPINDYVVAAGEAPPPPPKTWEDPSYTGRSRESDGILHILQMIKDDIKADRTRAQKAEDKAQEAFDEFERESNGQIRTLNNAIGGLRGKVSTKEGEVTEAEGNRNTKKGELVRAIDKIKDLQPGCDYMLVNYMVRSANRKIEIDGLEKAKAILKGAAFDERDPNREYVPGDALVQK